MEENPLKVGKQEHVVILTADGDMQVHIIKLGSEGLYAVMYDDAYQLFTGDTKVMTADQIRKEIYTKFEG